MTESILTDTLSIDERKHIFDENFDDIKKRISVSARKSGRSEKDIVLLAATKTIDIEVINYAIEQGLCRIGENKVQEFLKKEPFYASGAQRDFIGHLQTNKVKDIIDRVKLIHSVDSLKLVREIGKQSVKNQIVTDILLEINIGNEESKSGFLSGEIFDNLNEISKTRGIKVRGLMAIPPVCEDNQKNRPYFKEMNKLFVDIGNKKIDNIYMDFLSMGMSDDFDEAIEQGANIVRIGTALFGKRFYNK